jgi:hypothetical protein
MNERKTENDFWQAFSAVKLDILGGIIETVSKAMMIKPRLKLPILPRMADFAVWGYAIAEALGYKGQELDAYYANIEAQNREVISGNVIGKVVLKFMANRNEWQGTASELLAELEIVAGSLKISNKIRLHKGTENISTISNAPTPISGGIENGGGMVGSSGDSGSIFRTSGMGEDANNSNTSAHTYYGNKLKSFGNMSPEKPSTLHQDILRAGHEWQEMKVSSLNSTNMTEFCLWYCEHKDKRKQPSDIRAIAEKVFKITPAH